MRDRPRRTQRRQGPAHERVLARTERTDACWLFTGYRDAKGYGVVALPGNTTVQAHRAVYEALVGPIPDGFSGPRVGLLRPRPPGCPLRRRLERARRRVLHGGRGDYGPAR